MGPKLIANNIRDKYGILNLLRLYVLGNDTIAPYDENNTYDTNDKIFIIDNKGNVTIYEALEDNISGPFDKTKWRTGSVDAALETLNKTLIMLSTTKPVEKENILWLMPTRYSVHNLPPSVETPDISRLAMIFDNAEFPIVEEAEDTPVDQIEIGDIILDWEGEGDIGNTEFIDNFVADEEITIDEQEDIAIGAERPAYTDPALVWFDTDLSDDNI